MKMVLLFGKICMLFGLSLAFEKFDIRTKIEVEGNFINDTLLTVEIQKEITELFCETVVQSSENCVIRVLSEDLEKKDDQVNGEVKFLASVQMPAGTTKSDLQKEVETNVDEILNESIENPSGDGSGEASGEGSAEFIPGKIP